MTVVSVIVPLRDMEEEVASTIRSASQVRPYVRGFGGRTLEISLEILALDQRSGDNTLSVLSVLHGQVDGLRTLQDVDRGAAIRMGAHAARGDVWLVVDHPVDPTLGGWAASQVLSGRRAAVVPGEVLATDRKLGEQVLRRVNGGLISAQNAVMRALRKSKEPIALAPTPSRRTVDKARLFLRNGLGRLGLGRYDQR